MCHLCPPVIIYYKAAAYLGLLNIELPKKVFIAPHRRQCVLISPQTSPAVSYINSS